MATKIFLSFLYFYQKGQSSKSSYQRVHQLWIGGGGRGEQQVQHCVAKLLGIEREGAPTLS